MMNRRSLSSIVALLALITVMRPAAAAADTIIFLGDGKGLDMNIHSPALGDLTAHVGELNWSAPTSSSLAAEFWAYCIDANHYLSGTQTVTAESTGTLTSPGVNNPGGKVSWLLNQYGGSIHNTGTDLQSAALQLAIWAALYNNDGSLTSGSFHVNSTGPVIAQAQVFLDNLFANPTGYNMSTGTWLNATGGQDQLIASETPEPASMLLLGTGLLAAAGIRRRKSAALPRC